MKFLLENGFPMKFLLKTGFPMKFLFKTFFFICSLDFDFRVEVIFFLVGKNGFRFRGDVFPCGEKMVFGFEVMFFLVGKKWFSVSRCFFLRKCPVGLCITPCEGPAARTKTTEPDIFICKFVGYKQELLARIHIFFYVYMGARCTFLAPPPSPTWYGPPPYPGPVPHRTSSNSSSTSTTYY